MILVMNEFIMAAVGLGVIILIIAGGGTAFARWLLVKPKAKWTDLPVPGAKKKRRGVRKYNPDLKGRR